SAPLWALSGFTGDFRSCPGGIGVQIGVRPLLGRPIVRRACSTPRRPDAPLPACAPVASGSRSLVVPDIVAGSQSAGAAVPSAPGGDTGYSSGSSAGMILI